MMYIASKYSPAPAFVSRFVFTALILLASIISSVAQAHAPRENYVWINVETDHISGRFELNVADVRTKLGIDVDQSGNSRLEGVRSTAAEVQAYLADNLALSGDNSEYPIIFGEAQVAEENADFLQYPFVVEQLPADNLLTIENTVFLTPEYMASDRLHRSLIVFSYNRQTNREYGEENASLVFSPRNPVQTMNLLEPATILQWDEFLYQGILHIAFGLDHVLFIIVLLLTTVLFKGANGWEPIPDFRGALWKTLKIVTLFTIAHSITLSLAALDLVSVNSAVVESVIAFSIIAIAINNIYPKYSTHAWILIFFFGLFHGLGFASVMGDLQFRNVFIERILILFNVGVEVGQFIIVLVIFPILYVLRKLPGYKQWIVNPISAATACIALLWVLQRTGLVAA